MRVLITGGCGFIGRCTARRLLAEGDEVVILTRAASGATAAALAALGARVVEGDVRRAETLEAPVRGCDAVVHAAGLPRPSTRRAFDSTHVGGTQSALTAARRGGATRFIHVASQAVLFGGKDLVGIDDEAPYPSRFIDPYSMTKAAGERIALAEHRPGSFEVASIRPAVVWGPDDTTVLPIMIRLARSPLGIPTCGDGSNLEATTYIDHCVDAIVLALRASRLHGKPYLITDDFSIRLRDFLSRQLLAAGVKPRFTRIPAPLAYAMAALLDHAAAALGLPIPLARFGVRTAVTSRAMRGAGAARDLGYAPRVGLEEGMRRLGAWVQEQGGAAALVRRARKRE